MNHSLVELRFKCRLWHSALAMAQQKSKSKSEVARPLSPWPLLSEH